MAKGDDFKAKKKNKALRKKLNKDSSSSSVSARVASIIASKKRRLSGKRRQCQGMCFSLPTPDDPYNDQHGKTDPEARSNKKSLSKSSYKVSAKDGGDDNHASLSNQKAKRLKQMDNVEREKNAKMDVPGYFGCPSKFLCNCLNSIQDSLVGDGELEGQEKPFIANTWGIEFLKSCSLGKDILDNSGSSPSVQKIAWIASIAADSIQRTENERKSFNSPFLLYLVPSQEKAVQVRCVCKPLKAFGIHTVCLHAGTSVEHQVTGLKSCEPEFLVATPERVWELGLLKAIDISVVSLLVVDAMDTFIKNFDVVKRIKDLVSGKCQTVVFQGCNNDSSVKAVQKILKQPFHTLPVDESTHS